MNETYSAALDYILQSAAKVKPFGITFGSMRDSGTYYFTLKHELMEKFNMDDIDFSLLLKKLEDEGYLFKVNEESTRITLKGLDWISPEIGGFTAARQNHLRDRQTHDQNENALAGYTIVLAYGTIALVLCEISIHYPEIVKNLSALFSCGR